MPVPQPANPNYVYTTVDQILSPELLYSLTHVARRVYEKIWNLMSKKNTDSVWLSDHALSVSARANYDAITEAKTELEQAGLFKIRCGQWPADDPPNICHRYRFIAQD